MRQALSLKGDRGRLSIEGVLTGAALALTLAFLLENPVEAAAFGAGSSGAEDDGLEGGANQRPLRPRPGRPADDPSGDGDVLRSPAAAPLGTGDGGSMAGSVIAGLSLGSEGAGLERRSLGEDAGLEGADGGLALGSIPESSPPGTSPRGGRGLIRGRGATGPSGATTDTAVMAGDDTAPPALPGQRLEIRVERREGVVARSVEGPSLAELGANQVGLINARLDLSAARQPELVIASLRSLDGLALSVLGSAELRQQSQNRAVAASLIEGGSSDGSYRIAARDVLRYGLRAGGSGLVAIQNRVVGLQSSQLRDGGGRHSLAIDADLALSLGGSSASGPVQGQVVLTSAAVERSAIQLGDGADAVRITSRVSAQEAASPFPTAAVLPIWNRLALTSRALGLAGSLLSTGGGDDVVAITATAGEAVALEDSRIQLGPGNDRLLLQGDVQGSWIEPGSGANAVVVEGTVSGSTLVLDPEGQTAVELSDGADSLMLAGEGGISLRTGGGDDRISVAGRPVGWLEGGPGRDVLVLAPAADTPATPLLVVQGGNRGVAGALSFEGIESLALGDGDSRVVIEPGAALDGALLGDGGSDALDYGGWTDGVAVDLDLGSATGISDGKAGGIAGFETVRGGQGNDELVAGAGSIRLDGGAGEDRLRFDPLAARRGGASLSLLGGSGRDLFVVAGLDPLLLAAQAPEAGTGWSWGRPPNDGGPLPSLADLMLSNGPEGELLLSDRLAWQRSGILSGLGDGVEPLELTPSGLEGLGQVRMLPIAPLEALLAGIGSGPPQLAIATGPAASELVLLGGAMGSHGLAALPALQLPAPALAPSPASPHPV